MIQTQIYINVNNYPRGVDNDNIEQNMCSVGHHTNWATWPLMDVRPELKRKMKKKAAYKNFKKEIENMQKRMKVPNIWVKHFPMSKSIVASSQSDETDKYTSSLNHLHPINNWWMFDIW